jgi:hypothetical protein
VGIDFGSAELRRQDEQDDTKPSYQYHDHSLGMGPLAG